MFYWIRKSVLDILWSIIGITIVGLAAFLYVITRKETEEPATETPVEIDTKESEPFDMVKEILRIMNAAEKPLTLRQTYYRVKAPDLDKMALDESWNAVKDALNVLMKKKAITAYSERGSRLKRYALKGIPFRGFTQDLEVKQ